MTLMTVRQVADELGYSPDRVRLMARDRKIPMFKIEAKSDWRIAVEDFERWLKERTVNG